MRNSNILSCLTLSGPNFRLHLSFAMYFNKLSIGKKFITKTHLFKYNENFITKKGKISGKNSDIFHISAQNIDFGYSLEPPRRGGSNEYPQSMFWLTKQENIVYTPVNLSFNNKTWVLRRSELYRCVFVMYTCT